MKRFRYAVAALVLSVLIVFTSCDGGFPFGGKPSSSYGRNYSTFKKNMENYDYPKTPNFTQISESELRQFNKEMEADPDSRGCTVKINNGYFIYSQGNMSMRQDANGLWWGSVPLPDGSIFLMQYTNEWNANTAPACLPGKPNLKFVGWFINDISPTCKQWAGMFINDRNNSIESVFADYGSRLSKAGWIYGSDEYGQYYARIINGKYTEVTFASLGLFYCMYMTVYSD